MSEIILIFLILTSAIHVLEMVSVLKITLILNVKCEEGSFQYLMF